MNSLFVSTDKGLLNKRLIIDFLHGTHWAKNFSDERILKSIEHSFCFGLFEDREQVGFARVVTDFTYSAWIGDVFVVKEKQKQGYGKVLLNAILNHDSLKDIIKWRLSTEDAHSFYSKFGFTAVREPNRLMEKIISG